MTRGKLDKWQKNRYLLTILQYNNIFTIDKLIVPNHLEK